MRGVKEKIRQIMRLEKTFYRQGANLSAKKWWRVTSDPSNLLCDFFAEEEYGL